MSQNRDVGMPATYRVAQAILTLLQLVSIVALSAGSLRLKHWLIPPLLQVGGVFKAGAEVTPSRGIHGEKNLTIISSLLCLLGRRQRDCSFPSEE